MVGYYFQAEDGIRVVAVTGVQTCALPISLGNLAVIGDHDAAIAVSSQIFPGVKTKSRGVSQRSNPLALVARAMSLAGVFDHHQPVLVGKLSDGIHVGGVPVQMHGNNGFGAARDGSLDRLYVQRVRVWIDVHQYRCGPGMRYAERGGDEAVGRSDDLVARANVESPQRQLEEIGRASCRERV